MSFLAEWGIRTLVPHSNHGAITPASPSTRLAFLRPPGRGAAFACACERMLRMESSPFCPGGGSSAMSADTHPPCQQKGVGIFGEGKGSPRPRLSFRMGLGTNNKLLLFLFAMGCPGGGNWSPTRKFLGVESSQAGSGSRQQKKACLTCPDRCSSGVWLCLS